MDLQGRLRRQLSRRALPPLPPPRLTVALLAALVIVLLLALNAMSGDRGEQSWLPQSESLRDEARRRFAEMTDAVASFDAQQAAQNAANQLGASIDEAVDAIVAPLMSSDATKIITLVMKMTGEVGMDESISTPELVRAVFDVVRDQDVETAIIAAADAAQAPRTRGGGLRGAAGTAGVQAEAAADASQLTLVVQHASASEVVSEVVETNADVMAELTRFSVLSNAAYGTALVHGYMDEGDLADAADVVRVVAMEGDVAGGGDDTMLRAIKAHTGLNESSVLYLRWDRDLLTLEEGEAEALAAASAAEAAAAAAAAAAAPPPGARAPPLRDASTRLGPSAAGMRPLVPVPSGAAAIAAAEPERGVPTSTPAHYVALDAESGSVALVIRGTLSFADIVTDLLARPVPVPGYETMGGYAHSGMLKVALRFSRNGELVDALRRGCAARPNFALTVAGHSLGGGVATVLGLLWDVQGTFADTECGRRLRVVALASPASVNAILSAHAAARGLVRSVVLADDLVPQLSHRSVAELVDKVQAKVLQHRREAEQPGSSHAPPPGSASAATADSPAAGGGQSARADSLQFGDPRKDDLLMPGGTVYHVHLCARVAAARVPDSVACDIFGTVCLCAVQQPTDPLKQPRCRHALARSTLGAEGMGEILISSTSLVNHFPDRLETALRQLTQEGRLQQGRQRSKRHAGGGGSRATA